MDLFFAKAARGFDSIHREQRLAPVSSITTLDPHSPSIRRKICPADPSLAAFLHE